MTATGTFLAIGLCWITACACLVIRKHAQRWADLGMLMVMIQLTWMAGREQFGPMLAAEPVVFAVDPEIRLAMLLEVPPPEPPEEIDATPLNECN